MITWLKTTWRKSRDRKPRDENHVIKNHVTSSLQYRFHIPFIRSFILIVFLIFFLNIAIAHMIIFMLFNFFPIFDYSWLISKLDITSCNMRIWKKKKTEEIFDRNRCFLANVFSWKCCNLNNGHTDRRNIFFVPKKGSWHR